jgi:hypothetical protein
MDALAPYDRICAQLEAADQAWGADALARVRASPRPGHEVLATRVRSASGFGRLSARSALSAMTSARVTFQFSPSEDIEQTRRRETV